MEIDRDFSPQNFYVFEILRTKCIQKHPFIRPWPKSSDCRHLHRDELVQEIKNFSCEFFRDIEGGASETCLYVTIKQKVLNLQTSNFVKTLSIDWQWCDENFIPIVDHLTPQVLKNMLQTTGFDMCGLLRESHQPFRLFPILQNSNENAYTSVPQTVPDKKKRMAGRFWSIPREEQLRMIENFCCKSVWSKVRQIRMIFSNGYKIKSFLCKHFKLCEQYGHRLKNTWLKFGLYPWKTVENISEFDMLLFFGSPCMCHWYVCMWYWCEFDWMFMYMYSIDVCVTSSCVSVSHWCVRVNVQARMHACMKVCVCVCMSVRV